MDDDLVASCRTEVHGLHDFFVEWFNDGIDDTDAEFARVARALHPSFSMVVPSGRTLDRVTALEQIRGAHASATEGDPVRIAIVDVVSLVAEAGGVLVNYEEQQFSGEVPQNRRISTAYFTPAPGAPNGVQWLRLHETLVSDG